MYQGSPAGHIIYRPNTHTMYIISYTYMYIHVVCFNMLAPESLTTGLYWCAGPVSDHTRSQVQRDVPERVQGCGHTPTDRGRRDVKKGLRVHTKKLNVTKNFHELHEMQMHAHRQHVLNKYTFRSFIKFSKVFCCESLILYTCIYYM